ncbi:hypothetical protein [Anaerotignum lactatifermentans]|uniref:hypothetical protein n=1 Tax=Anaerotignum lactatifermentans TaxID=160404 RepID=UPI00174DB43C|nr:hypothetical protein [Anaerotignum lactatifermentans]
MDRKEAFCVIQNTKTAMIGNKKLDMPAMGTECVDNAILSYIWYKPLNERELEAINVYYNLNFQTNKIGKWIGIETSLCMDVFENLTANECVYEALDIEVAMENTINFWQSLGYKISIC